LNDPEKTAAQFMTIGGVRWYKTGDLAYCDEKGCFHYLGRVDNQVKILGNRVELEEVECHLRDSTGCADVAAVAWPQHGGSASGVVAFLVSAGGSEESIKGYLQERLPPYMVPTRIHFVGSLPLNANGTLDRSALVRMLNEGAIA
jgi:acyl-coenzyme A synthetase/AMP-(fatty) acid ligase